MDRPTTELMRSICRVAMLLLIQAGTMLYAEPCTLYRTEDIANARENVARYAWARKQLEAWKSAASFPLKQERGFFSEMISPLTNWPEYGQNCPVCVGKKSSMGECGIYNWDVQSPDRLVCKYCKTAYPNPDYPETGTLACSRMGQQFTYYETEEERAHPEDRSGKHAFRWASWPVHSSWSGVIRSRKSRWCRGKMSILAKLYALTGDSAYAERTAWILVRYAEVYPGWLFHSYNGTFADCPPAEAAANMGKHGGGGKFSPEVIVNAFGLHRKGDYATLCNGFWGGGRFGCSGSDGGFILSCLQAYDLTRDATLSDGSPVYTPEMHQRIAEDLLLPGCVDSENWNDINNKCGPGRALSAAVGIMFQKPTSARRALEGFQALMGRCFHTDGFCKESPSYSGMHLGLMGQIPEILRGYSDPPGYVDADGKRYDDMDPFSEVPRYRAALESMVRMRAPGGGYPVIGDTHYRSSMSPRYLEILTDRFGDHYAPLLVEAQGAPLEEKGSEYALWFRRADLTVSNRARLPLHTEWFPGWHVAVLRAGEPSGATALYLNGYESHGHRHYDTLGLILYAQGKELVSDRGYIWDDPRNAWTRSTLSHNLVTVDGSDQMRKGRGSVLELFGTSPLVEVVSASANAYQQCSLYERSTALVRFGADAVYVVDVFRVKGGRQHDYGLQCNGRLLGVCGVDLAPIDESHRWLSDYAAGESRDIPIATWEHGETAVDWHILNGGETIVTANAPGWRSDRGSEINAPPIGQVFARREADEEGELESVFVSLIVPRSKEAKGISGTVLLADSNVVAVNVSLGDRQDTLVFMRETEQREVDNLSVDARFAFHARQTGSGNTVAAYLLDGTLLETPDQSLRLASPRRHVGVSETDARTYHLTEALADGACLRGNYILAAGTGFEVEDVTDRRLTVRDYAAIPCKEIVIPNSIWFADKETLP